VLGLVAGSITLVGGHGTGAAYAERFAEEHDILGVMGLTASAGRASEQAPGERIARLDRGPNHPDEIDWNWQSFTLYPR